MPSSLTRFHSRAFGIFYPPTCVGLRYGRPREHPESFLGVRFGGSGSARRPPRPPLSERLARSRASPLPRPRLFLRLNQSRRRNIEPAKSIVYALRPRLRSRLTLGGRTFPRKPWVYGGGEFHPSYRYSCLHSHLQPLHRKLSPLIQCALQRSPTNAGRRTFLALQSFGMPLKSPIIFGAETLDESAITHCLNDGCL